MPETFPKAAGVSDLVAQYSASITSAAKALQSEASETGAMVWDPFDPEWARDPYPVYERLREHNPVHRSPLGFWVFTRHGDCLALLRDRRCSTDQRNLDPDRLIGMRPEIEGDPMAPMLEEMAPFLFRDPPDHTRLRGLVQKAFTPKVIESLRPRIEQICDELIDDALEKGEVDLVADLAYPLPLKVIVEMMGVPEEDHELFRGWSDALARGLDPDFLLPAEAVQQRLVGILSFIGYFGQLLEQRRQNPGDDLLSALIAAEEQGDFLSTGELLATSILLLVAGHETTVNLISGSILALVQNPSQMQRLRDDPGIVRNAVEELMRFVSPVQLTGRGALEDIDVAGVRIAKGEFAMLLIGSANRDPAVFDRPNDLDLQRREVNHLGFGFGIHHCLGAPLARLEAGIALPTLLRRARRLELDMDNLRFKENLVLRGVASLPASVSA